MVRGLGSGEQGCCGYGTWFLSLRAMFCDYGAWLRGCGTWFWY